MEKRQRPLSPIVLGFGVAFVALLGAADSAYTETIAITSGGISALAVNDFQANGSLIGPRVFYVLVASNAQTCGPCASIATSLLRVEENLNLNTAVLLFGRPSLPVPTDFIYQGDPYAISGGVPSVLWIRPRRFC